MIGLVERLSKIPSAVYVSWQQCRRPVVLGTHSTKPQSSVNATTANLNTEKHDALSIGILMVMLKISVFWVEETTVQGTHSTGDNERNQTTCEQLPVPCLVVFRRPCHRQLLCIQAGVLSPA